jgi:hypothetical protein
VSQLTNELTKNAKTMIQLPFSCYCTELKVHPKNWQLQKVSVKKNWYVFYWFYDPNFLNDSKFKYGKLVVIKRIWAGFTVLGFCLLTCTFISLNSSGSGRTGNEFQPCSKPCPLCFIFNV